MLNIKKVGFAALVFSMCCTGAAARDIQITQDSFTTGDEIYTFENTPFSIGETVYISAADFFSALGYKTEQIPYNDAFSVTGNGKQSLILSDSSEHIVGYGMYTYSQPSFNIDGNEYISIALAEDISQMEINISGQIPTLSGPDISGTYRFAENSIVDCGNCFVLNRKYMFSPVIVHDRRAKSYAQIINRIAAVLPDVNVYNMLVPDSCEIYAPKRFYTGQKRAFDIVEKNLSHEVQSVNATDALFSHSDEKIYFSTDHHWTQRGAFYAWNEYAKLKGFEPLELDDFENCGTDSFSGSYIKRLGNGFIAKDVLDNTSETLERFMPVYDTAATVYSTADMEKMMGKVPLINTKNNTYSCFISGDHPLTVIESSIGNGKKLAIIKDSFGNALSTWAVNNYQYVYVIDIRGFAGGKLKISDFYSKTQFDDLIIESYPTTIESKELSGYLSEMAD